MKIPNMNVISDRVQFVNLIDIVLDRLAFIPAVRSLCVAFLWPVHAQKCCKSTRESQLLESV